MLFIYEEKKSPKKGRSKPNIKDKNKKVKFSFLLKKFSLDTKYNKKRIDAAACIHIENNKKNKKLGKFLFFTSNT